MDGDRNNFPAETATHQDEIDGTSQPPLIPPPVNNATTLLPSRLASAVSFLAQSTSLTVRIGTLFGGAALGSARATTLTGLELSRALVETILTKAGRDVVGQAQDEYGKVEAESILERSLAALHATVTSTSFFASAGFHLSEAALTSMSNLSQNLLYTLDAILGSTESSRAIAAIITLIRKEFSREGNVNNSELVGVGDLLVGSVGFALLQRWGQPNSERRMRESAGEVIIWDVVILDNGLRADVIGTQSTQYMHNMLNDAEGDVSRPASFMDSGGNQASIDALERVSPYPENSLQPPNTTTSIHPQLSDEEIQAYIIRQLPQGTRISIRSEVVTARTITVDVYDENEIELIAPPGTMVVAERFHHDQDSQHIYKRLPKHTIVFRTAFNESSDTDERTAGSDVGTLLGNRTLPYEVDTDIPSSNHDDKSYSEKSQPQTTEVHANEGRRRPRRNPSSSSLSGSETSKLSFGKAPFSKITQKVRPSLGEKPSSQKDVTKKASKKVSSVLPIPSNKPGDHESPRKSSESVTSSPLPPSKNTEIRAPTPASLNRALPPPPPTNRYTKYRSTPSPTASRLSQPSRGAAVAEGLSIERDGESFVTHTDSFSVHPIESRPGSASYKRTHIRSSSSLSCTRRTQPQSSPKSDSHPPEQYQDLRRTRSFVPSIYSIATGSETSLILAPRPRKSVYEDESTIIGLNRNGLVPGIFPHNHLVKNIRRFCRFSSASYGSNAMRMMGVQHDLTAITKDDDENQEHSSFSNMTGLPASAILLSSFVDPAGGSNAAGETESGFPLVHYLFLDHESKAIVLALRGTWGFEDILTDMTCDYDDVEWQGKNWKVHKGMHASAKRLLEGGGQRVMATIKAALEEFPEYGVIFCGHSLGGGVAALLATMISQPSTTVSGPSFVTATAFQARAPLILTTSHQQETARRFSLPPDRPIHVYAFGPPACMSPFLRRATRGLVTTVVNGKDVVPHLSLGILHDLRVVALSFKKDASNSKSHIRTRVWEGLRQSIANKFYVSQTPPISSPYGGGKYIGEEDTWAWSTLQSLREEMTAPKLVPPGEVFVVETMRVLQRNPFTARPSATEAGGHSHLGRPATRVQLKFIRDVETYFSELKFSSGMLGDHNPARYEANLAALAKGIIDE